MCKDENDAGFVHIQTHRCFRDGIVQIGHTQGEVEKRNKQLFSTELPWLFDTYATLKTSCCVETEKLIHYFLDDKRINPKRVFFAISPEKALEIFYKVREVLPDCEIIDNYKREKVCGSRCFALVNIFDRVVNIFRQSCQQLSKIAGAKGDPSGRP